MAVTPKVLLKRSSVIGKVPVAGDLQYGELAINFADGRIYYKDANDNIKNFVDSAIIQSIVSEMSTDSAEVINLIQTYSLDSSEIIALIDSGYVQARQDFSYASLTGVPDIAAIAKANSTDSAEVSSIITSDVDKSFVDALNVDADTLDGNDGSYYLDWTNVTNKPDLTDSVYAQGMIDSNFQNLSQSIVPISNGTVDLGSLSNRFGSIYLGGSTIYLGTLALSDSNGSLLVRDTTSGEKAAVDIDSQIAALITSAYIQARQSYDYNQLINVPTLQDSSQVSSIITNQVNKSFVDALNVDADTLDGQNASWYRDWTNTTNKPVILDNVDVDLQIDNRVDKAYVDALNVDADTLDNLNSTQFLRSDQSDSMQGSLTIDNNLTVGGYVAGPATFYIDPAGVGDNTGKVVIRGDLQVDGVQTIVNSTTVSINDKNIVLADSAADSAEADGAGITVNGANAKITYTASTDTWDFNKKVSAPNIDVSGAFVSNTLVGKYLGFDSDFAQKSTDDLTEGSTNQYYLKARVDSDIAASLNDSGNTVTVTINNTIEDKVDSAYVLDRVSEAPFLDSADAINLIDSAYVQVRQDYAYASLTGAPTNVSQFANDAGYITTAQSTDSAEVISIIDSAYVQARQNFAYASLTGAPNVLDSANISSIIIADVDQAFVNGLNVDADNLDGQTGSFYLNYNNLTNTPNVLDSADVTNLIDSAYIAARTSAGTDSATVVSIINSTVDSAYISALGFGAGGGGGTVDSADIIAIVDSAYVQARQLNETAAPLTQSIYNFTADSGQSSFTGLDVDSGKFQVYLNGLLLPRSDFTHNSSKVDLLVAADSGDVLEVIKFSGNDTGAQAIQQRHYVYTATSSQTIFTGADDNAATLSYTQGRVNVYLNGLLLLDTVDYTQNAAGNTITFTSGVTAGHIVNIQTLSGNTGSFAPLSQTLYEYTADSGQTVFTGVDDNAATLDFSNDKITVYLNGILLSGADYTPSGGNRITLDVGADSGNLLTVAKLSGNNIGIDSGDVRNLIDSAYISALGFGSGGGTDSATVISIINEYIVQSDSDFTTTGANQVVDTFAAATYRTAKYLVQFSHPSDSKYHSTEVLLMHDGTTVYMTEYAEVKTDSSLGTIDADINAGNVRLLVTPSYTNTGVNVTRTNVTV